MFQSNSVSCSSNILRHCCNIQGNPFGIFLLQYHPCDNYPNTHLLSYQGHGTLAYLEVSSQAHSHIRSQISCVSQIFPYQYPDMMGQKPFPCYSLFSNMQRYGTNVPYVQLEVGKDMRTASKLRKRYPHNPTELSSLVFQSRIGSMRLQHFLIILLNQFQVCSHS